LCEGIMFRSIRHVLDFVEPSVDGPSPLEKGGVFARAWTPKSVWGSRVMQL